MEVLTAAACDDGGAAPLALPISESAAGVETPSAGPSGAAASRNAANDGSSGSDSSSRNGGGGGGAVGGDGNGGGGGAADGGETGTVGGRGGPGGPGGIVDREAWDAVAAKVRRRRNRQMAARARFGAETAARTGNGYIGAKMVRAQLLHYAILRLLGAASLAHSRFYFYFFWQLAQARLQEGG